MTEVVRVEPGKWSPTAGNRMLPSGTESEFRCVTRPFAECAELTAELRNANRDVVRDETYFDWRYRKVPCAAEALVCFALAPGGRPVAAASIIPHEMFVQDAVYEVGFVGDVSVLPEYRGRGLAQALMSHIGSGVDIGRLRGCLVLPNAELLGALRRARWQVVGELRRFVAPLELTPLLGRRLGEVGRRAIGPLADALLSAVSAWRRRRLDPGYTMRLVRRFGDEQDALWDQIDKRDTVLSVRDSGGLNWRFVAHPGIDHRMVQIYRDSELAAYVVLRAEGRVLVVEDFLAIDAAAARAGSAIFLAAARAEHWGEIVHVRCNAGSRLHLGWWQQGFIRRADRQFVMWVDAWWPKPHPRSAPHWYILPADKDV